MKKILYLSELDLNGKFGGAVVEKKNYEFLNRNYNIEVAGVYAKGRKITRKIIDVIFSKVPTLYSYNEERKISNIIKNSDAEIVFIETTKMGYFAKVAKKYNKRVITFVHNCETVLYLESRGKIYVPLIKKQEEMSVNYSDMMIFLNERDKDMFNKLYGESFSYSIQPICLDDAVCDSDIVYMKKKKKEKTGLFLGSLFPPNYNGIKYFIENVADKIDAKIQIVGLNFENCHELERSNVELIGTVKETKEYLLNADFIILPIFEGSGMKVKTCECMMYGKRIFASDEALEGYRNMDGAFYRCNSSEEFIQSINTYLTNDTPVFNDVVRRLFLSDYSSKVYIKNMRTIIESIV